jgi:lactoylglutathione lyase
MQLGYVIAYVPDVAETIGWWERAFGIERRFLGPEGQYGELETGSTALAFAGNGFVSGNLPGGFTPHDPSQPPCAIEIALVTDDVAGALARALDAGATLVAEPATKPWGQTVAYLRDPNGILVELATPMG